MTYLPRLLSVVALAALGLGAQAAPLATILERGAIEIAAYENFPPWSYKEDGRRAGIDVDIAEALAAELGVGLVVRLVGVDENMEDDLRANVWKGHYIGRGPADAMIHVPFNHDNSYTRENDLVRFLAPYYRESMVLASPVGRPGPEAISAIGDADRVAVELDTLADFYLSSEGAGDRRENAARYANLSAAVDDLRGGEVAAMFGPRGEVQGVLAAAGVEAVITPVELRGFQLQAWDVGLAVRFNHQALIEALLAAMQTLRERGEIAAIFSRHGVDYVAPSARALQVGYLQRVEQAEGDDD